MSQSECIICVEKYNKSTRLPVKCEYCEFTACRDCCQKYILNEVQPRCMDNVCGREWSRRFIHKSFTNTFVNGDLKKHRQDVLFDREKSLLPATQPIVENMIEMERLKEEVNQIDETIQLLMRDRRNILHELGRRNLMVYDPERFARETQEEAADLHRECPDATCHGYLSSQWKCGLCAKWVCKDCHVIKGENRDAEHTCDPNVLASAKLIAQDSRNCPKCRVSIYRIDGCDQMFCTRCNTAFDWRSGRIIHGNIHNPHYFEWMQNQNTGGGGRNRGVEDLCARNVDERFIRDFRDLFREKRPFSENNPYLKTINLRARIPRFRNEYCSYEMSILEKIRLLVQMRDYHVNRNRTNITYLNQKLRVEYMRNNITQELFKKKVQESDKRYMKELEITNLFEMVYHSLSDIFLRYYNALAQIPVVELHNYDYLEEIQYPDELQPILDEIPALLNYANPCFEEISRVYGSTKKYAIQDDIRVLSVDVRPRA
jgi:hypothetical protein